MARAKLVLEYDGKPFAGWQKQSAERTVQGEVERAFSTVLRSPVVVRGAGRTDAGVHARGQVADLEIDSATDLFRLQWSVNALLAPYVAVKAITFVEDGFDARRSARQRTYSYRLWNRRYPSPLLAERCWWVPVPLRLAKMKEAAACLIGKHDFAAYCTADGNTVTTVRRAAFVRQRPAGPITFWITADAFFYHMVRLLMGSLVWVGRGKLSVTEFKEILESRDVRRAAPMAPARGLCLEEVEY